MFKYLLLSFNNPWIVPKLSKRMPKTALKNLFICRFHTGKSDFLDFLDLGVPCSILMYLIQTNYWAQTKMWYFLESWELVLTDGSGFVALPLAEFGQCSKMRNFLVIFGNLSNMRKIEFSKFCQIFNSGINSA